MSFFKSIFRLNLYDYLQHSFPSWFKDVNICGQHNLKCLIAYTIGPYTFKMSETNLTKIPEIMIDNKIFNLKYINVSLKSY